MISRQRLIEELAECTMVGIDRSGSGLEWEDYVKFNTVVELIKSQPPADQWIPVSERLPDKEWGYIVTCNNYESDFCIYVPGKGFGMYSDGKWHSADDEVTAWMPLPEPYKGE